MTGISDRSGSDIVHFKIAGKKGIICIAIVCSILFMLAIAFYEGMKSEGKTDDACSVQNANAKVIYFDIETYAKMIYRECGESLGDDDFVDYGRFFADGIYCGRVSADYRESLKEEMLYDGSADDLNIALNYLLGGGEFYYCAVIRDGALIQTYYSKTDYVVKNARSLAAETEREDTDDNTRRSGFFNGCFGGYPIMIASPTNIGAPKLTSDESDLPVYCSGD